MKRLGARDFEDLLQCAMPVFDGLLPEPHNSYVQDLLFDLATWHAYAKLRLHTTDTLNFFDNAVTSLGVTACRFLNKTCEAYYMQELPQETAVRSRRVAALVAKNGVPVPSGTGEAKQKRLNLQTYKYHALADYPNTIQLQGTTDSYSTQPGEMEHQRLKQCYVQTPKNRATTLATMSKLEALERFIGLMLKEVENLRDNSSNGNDGPGPKRVKRKRTSPSDCYHIAESGRSPIDITVWLRSHLEDRATHDFMDRLKDHLLQQIHSGPGWDSKMIIFTDEARNDLIIVRNAMYEHKTLSINYTTYDLQREQDTINPQTRADIMVLLHETESNRHPYWYARVVKIFHVNVCYYGEHSNSNESQCKDVLLVRWFGRNLGHRSGFGARHLPRIEFLHEDDPDAFSFLDPDVVIHGVHLIPTFSLGHTSELLGPSIARQKEDGDEDWQSFDVNIFADRDTFMRFHGGGVGHTITRDWDEFLQSDYRDFWERRRERNKEQNENEVKIDMQDEDLDLEAHGRDREDKKEGPGDVDADTEGEGEGDGGDGNSDEGDGEDEDELDEEKEGNEEGAAPLRVILMHDLWRFSSPFDAK
ncbi:hypothetical protein EV363DRAFT_1568842 [Boletus edulis]|nr:hypothetical protein EV363DRAFT_1568842 [Boletus edulis]